MYNAITMETVSTDTNAVEVTVGYNKPVLNYTQSNTISQIDSIVGHWYIRGDSAVKSLKSFNLTFSYPNADAFTRLAGGRAQYLASIPVLDSIGARTSITATTLSATGLTLDSAKPVLFVVPAEFKGDTLFAATYKVGPGRTYRNLTEVARKLNGSYIGGDLVFEMAADYDDDTEQFPIYFDRLRYSDGSRNILIKLDSGAMNLVTGSGTQVTNAALGMISLSGVDSITFDGNGYDLLGHATGIREWTFKTETNSANASVFMLRNDSRYVTLKNLNILVNAELTNQGGVLIGPALTGGRGNDFLTLQNNFFNISDRVGIYGVLSIGTAAAPNDSVRIIENEFSNFRQGHILGSTGTGSGWLVSRNHFYQNDARSSVYAARAIDMQVDATIAGLEISYNYFGGTTRNAGGAQWNYTGTTAFYMTLVAAQSGSVSVYKNNIIRNITQTTTANITTQLAYFLRGNWQVTGNKIGGNSWTDAITTNTSGIFSCLYFINSTTNTAEVTDNEISFVRQNTGVATTTKAIHAIDLLSPNYFYIARNKIHDLITTSTRITGVQDGGLEGIYINSSQTGFVIEDNEFYNFTALPGTGYTYICAIGINTGGGTIRNNNINRFYYSSTNANMGHIVGIHAQGSPWNIYNNQISLVNELYPNMTLSFQGIRMYSTTLPVSRVAHNTIFISGVSKNSTTYGIVHGSASVTLDMSNNIVVNRNINTTPLNASARTVAVHAGPSGTYYTSDNNLVYASNPATTFFNASTNLASSFDTWKTSFGKDRSTLNFVPEFKDTLTNLMLTDDTINWALKASGKQYNAYVTDDYEGDIRSTTQPDIGVDEFTAPMYQQPVLVSGNDTLCQGNARSIIAQNPNTDGRIHWFGSLNGNDTLYIGDTLNTANISTNTTFYAQVSDSLVKSYRLAVPVIVKPVIIPALLNLPVDSICYGTTVALNADSTIGSIINWYTDTLVAPINTGNSYQTPALTTDTTYYLQTTYNGCSSAFKPFKIRVSALIANAPVVNNQQICEGNPVNWTTSPDVLRWYTGTRTNLAPLTVDTMFTTGNLNRDTTFYYEVFNGNCASERKSVSVQVNMIPALPVIDTLQTVCYNTSLNLTATAAGTIRWFDSDTATVPVTTGSLNTGNLLQDTVYYVDNELNNCTSNRVKVSILVKQPQTPVLTSVVSPICFNNTSNVVVSKPSNGTVRWFDQLAATTPIATGDTIFTTALAADLTYYFDLFDGTCTSSRDSVTITVNAFAAQPVITAVDSICFGTTDTLFATATGAAIQWYENRTSPLLVYR